MNNQSKEETPISKIESEKFPSNLPILPPDVEYITKLTEQLAEQARQLTPEELKKAERRYAEIIEGWDRGPKAPKSQPHKIKDILANVRQLNPLGIRVRTRERSLSPAYYRLATLLAIFALVIAACGSSIEAISPATANTPTTSEVASVPEQAEEEVTPTIQLTPTEEPTPTIEPTEAPFSFNLPEATLDNVEIPEVAKNQFPLEEKTFLPEGISYREFACVTDELKVDEYEIAPGVKVMASAECWYEQDGKQYSVRIPLVYANDDQLIMLGYEARDWWVDPADGWREKVWIENESKEEQKRYWNSWLEKVGFTGIGHIFNVLIIEPDPNNLIGMFQGFGNEQLQAVYTQEVLDQFSESGNPDVVGGILYSPEPGMNNTLNNKN